MALIFCNIGWMSKYNGIDGDSIERGGEYNKHSIGHEVCNFAINRGILYGYVQPAGETIKIEKIGATRADEKIDNVTVVWTAGPESGGTVVVGWYKGATVYRNSQKILNPNKLQKRNGVTHYRVAAPANEAVLLPVDQRELLIPRAVKGGIGQSNVWFADSPESRQVVERVLSLISGQPTEPLPDVDYQHSAREGNPRLIAHLRRERSLKLVKAKRRAVLKATGKLCCEVCDFDFRESYGELGEGYCEVHHLKQLSKSDGKAKTELKDLAVVCSNCHRIIHRSDPMLSLDQLSKHVRKRSG